MSDFHLSGSSTSSNRISSSNNFQDGSSSSSSPAITSITQDQLYSILLLLPVDSILSFAMTCRRARSLANSNSLWESICRRDWAPHSFDSTTTTDWKILYRRVHRLDRVSCRYLSSSSSDLDGAPLLHPKARASHSLNFVSGCLVLFGGGSEGGCHLDDTWAAYIGDNIRGMWRWQKIVSGSPSGRFGHSCVVIGDCLVLFGGINDHGIRQNDTWVGQVAVHETSGITLAWRLLDIGLVAPPARGAHAGCSIDNKRMIIHGGIGLSGLRLGDTWVLDLSEDLCFGTWHEVVTHPLPPARSGHTLTFVGECQTVLFGGRGLGYEALYDVWIFDTSGGESRWAQVPFELRSLHEGRSLARVGHSATLVLGGRVLIYGGEDSYRHRKNDYWLLDVKSRSSVKMQQSALNQRETLPISWKRLKSEDYEPNCRSFHRACADHTGCYMYVFGGMVDGVIQPAESSGLRFDGELFIVELLL